MKRKLFLKNTGQLEKLGVKSQCSTEGKNDLCLELLSNLKILEFEKRDSTDLETVDLQLSFNEIMGIQLPPTIEKLSVPHSTAVCATWLCSYVCSASLICY